MGRNGKEVWISASYTPIRDEEGKVCRIIKFAQDVTMQKLRATDFEGQISAIRKSNAVIEFDLSGNILYANDIFAEAMGYADVSEIINHHHSMFVSDCEIQSGDYSKFRDKLQRGEFFSGNFNEKSQW